MKMQILDKNFESGLRILEIYNLFLNQNLSRYELIEKLKDKESLEYIYTAEGFRKYFNALALSGLKINKSNSQYKLENALTSLNLSKEELDMLVILLQDYRYIHERNAENILRQIVFRLNKYIDMDICSIFEQIVNHNLELDLKNVRANLVMTLEKYLYDKQNVIVTYKKSKNISVTETVELREIFEQKGFCYVKFYIPQKGKYKTISIDSIVKIEQNPKKNTEFYSSKCVVFKVIGRLVGSYKLKEGEKLIDFSDSHLTISSAYQDKNELLNRLLKYGDSCEILSPVAIRKEFADLTKRILYNLENGR